MAAAAELAAAEAAAAKQKQEEEEFEEEVEVEEEMELDIDALIRSMVLEERLYRHRCVEAWSMTIPWTGFAFADETPQSYVTQHRLRR